MCKERVHWNSRNYSMSEARPGLCGYTTSLVRIQAAYSQLAFHKWPFPCIQKRKREGNKGPDVRRIHQIPSDKETRCREADSGRPVSWGTDRVRSEHK